ncbi:MAG: hypothetical protein OSJ27_02055 [Candidatus Gastranaerophilales bacterium]|nr:hypothetical protein [Candidatus Gastranaerophilales bacterium]
MQCNRHTSGCPGADGNNCNPNILWAGTVANPPPCGDNCYYDGYLNGGTFNINTNTLDAFGVRCVPDLDFLKRRGFRDEDR